MFKLKEQWQRPNLWSYWIKTIGTIQDPVALWWICSEIYSTLALLMQKTLELSLKICKKGIPTRIDTSSREKKSKHD